MNFRRFVDWVNGDYPAEQPGRIRSVGSLPERQPAAAKQNNKDPLENLKTQMLLYRMAAVLVCLSLMFALTYTVLGLPTYKDPNAPTNNEVS